MQIEITPGVIGGDGVAWGSGPDGSPVLLLRSPQIAVRIVFTPDEAQNFGTTAIYLAVAARVATQAPPSRILAPDGGPVQ